MAPPPPAKRRPIPRHRQANPRARNRNIPAARTKFRRGRSALPPRLRQRRRRRPRDQVAMTDAPLKYELLNRDGNARLGRVTTRHGIFDTPAFMPVGTQGTIKGLLPDHVAATGSQIIL